VTVKFTGTTSTYPFRAFSQASRNLALRPYTSSAVTQANGTPASAAPVIIAVPSAGLVLNSASSGTCARSRRARSAHQPFGRYSRKSNRRAPGR
jgi:hypothetical protein